jgi:hypothetical protein
VVNLPALPFERACVVPPVSNEEGSATLPSAGAG